MDGRLIMNVSPSGIPNTELVVPGETATSSKVTLMSKSSSKSSHGSKKSKKKEQQLLTASVVSAKTTLGHRATVEARDEAYQASDTRRQINLLYVFL